MRVQVHAPAGVVCNRLVASLLLAAWSNEPWCLNLAQSKGPSFSLYHHPSSCVRSQWRVLHGFHAGCF